MREQIYIDGVLMEQTGDKTASLVFQSPFFTDIDSITGNRSNAIDFPATDANRRALGLAHLDRSGSRYAEKRHEAQYYLDGVQVFSGTAILQGITPKALKFSFTWGNTTAFGRLLETKIRDLQTTDTMDYVPYTMGGIVASGRYGRNMDFVRMPVPTMGAGEVLSRLAGKTGVTIDVAPFMKYRIPLLTRRADQRSKEAQALDIETGQIRFRNTTSYSGYTAKMFVMEATAQDSDLKEMMNEDGVIDVRDVSKLRVTIAAGTQYALHVVYSDLNNSIVKAKQQIAVYACDEDGGSIRQIAALAERNVESVTVGGQYYHRVRYTAKKQMDIDVSEFSYVLIGVGGVGGVGQYDDNGGLSAGRLNVMPDAGDDAEVVVGGLLPLYANLPDWTGSQLLKNLMKIEGLFPLCPDYKTINFASVDTLYANRAEAYDWTERINLEDMQPEERTSSQGGYYQKNLFQWAKDEAVTGEYDGVLGINDETLEMEGELVSVDFAATDGGTKPLLKAWQHDEEGEWQYVAEGYTPRILVADTEENYSFAGMDWGTLIATKYKAYARMVSRPRIVKCRAVMDAAELGMLDMAKPVYSYGAGRYWGISKLTTSGDGTATVELLRMSEEGDDASSLTLPTYANPTQGLVVLMREDGRWVTRCASHSDENNDIIAGDSAYRIVLERWGYARRGKAMNYLNKYGVMQTTHTTRKGAIVIATPQVWACYDAQGSFIGYDNIANVPDKGWAVSWYPERKYVYHAAEGYWQEAEEGHIFRDSQTKGDGLPISRHRLSNDRYGSYENARDKGGYTKKWRQIGWDILIHGSEPEHSQTYTSGRYVGATLVSQLGDALTLPTPGPWVIGKQGRIHNHGNSGLVELAVSLWHHEPKNGGWVRVSNRVRVRSRTKDCTQMWEFNEGNIVEV